MQRLQGKVILITGAGGGIGSACVERFVGEGALVAAADLAEARVQQLAGRLGSQVLPLAVDVGKVDEMTK